MSPCGSALPPLDRPSGGLQWGRVAMALLERWRRCAVGSRRTGPEQACVIADLRRCSGPGREGSGLGGDWSGDLADELAAEPVDELPQFGVLVGVPAGEELPQAGAA